MIQGIKHGAVFLIVFAAIIFEQHSWDEMMNQSISTVSAFEIEEAGLSAVLSDAIRDQREVVEHLEGQANESRAEWFSLNSTGNKEWADEVLPELARAEALHFQALTVLGLLEATREREAGNLT